MDLCRVSLRAQPTVLAVPLGGFRQILEFLDKSPQLLPVNTKLKVLFDEDVKSESLSKYTADNDMYMLALFSRLQNHISYLPWTPEVGLIELFSQDIQTHENGIKIYFSDNRVSFPHNWETIAQGSSGKQIRDAAKKSLSKITTHIENLLGKPTDTVRTGLFDYLIQQTDKQGTHDVKDLIQRAIYN